jgi:hypothetical protein
LSPSRSQWFFWQTFLLRTRRTIGTITVTTTITIRGRIDLSPRRASWRVGPVSVPSAKADTTCGKPPDTERGKVVGS